MPAMILPARSLARNDSRWSAAYCSKPSIREESARKEIDDATSSTSSNMDSWSTLDASNMDSSISSLSEFIEIALELADTNRMEASTSSLDQPLRLPSRCCEARDDEKYKRVHFQCRARIREYAVTVGDHTSVVCPITLDWKHSREYAVKVDFGPKDRLRTIPRNRRRNRVLRTQGISKSELQLLEARTHALLVIKDLQREIERPFVQFSPMPTVPV
jgi:hypothetical protein